MAFRFLHLADLHLATVFGGRPETKARLRDATLEAWDAALELAIGEELHAILIAGDAFDDPDLDRRVELHFRRGIQRCAEAGIHVLYCCGNHDPGGAAFRAAKLDLAGEADWQQRVHLFAKATPKAVTITDAEGDDVGIVVGVGHSKVGVDVDLVAKLGAQDTELPVVGLVHTQVTGARSSEDHAVYAPSTRESFLQAGFDYWALGHVHRRQQVFEDLPVWYAGNLQGRSPKPSEGGPKGGLVVELEAGVPVEPRFVAFAPVTWERATIDGLEAAATTAALIEILQQRVETIASGAEGEVCVRLIPTGPCPMSYALLNETERKELEQELTETTSAIEVQLRPDGLHKPRDLDEIRATPSVVAQTLQLIEEFRSGTRDVSDLPIEHLAMEESGIDADSRRDYLMDLLEGLEETYLNRALKVDA
tara:strand:- start:2029 stop:3294 length:1266 start_codon:yes stop_codon:yes gene_type:complete